MGPSECTNGVVNAADAVNAVGAVDTAADVGDVSAWERAHRALSRLARRRAALDAEEGRCLLAALRAAAHVHLGFGTFPEYIERLLGYSPRSTYEKVRVAEALEGLPVLSRALEQGALTWSALRELTRVASIDTAQEWLEFARGKTVRQLEEVVAGTRPGDGPDSPRVPSARRHVLRFEVTPETFALFREASVHLRRHGDSAFDDDAILLAMARAVLGGPTDEGRASYQVALSVCSECGRAEQNSSGALVVVGPEIVAMASCDAQHIGNVTAPANDDAATATAPNIPASLHTAPVRAHEGARAKQTIPPAIRRAVLHGQHHRCCVPGCKNATFLDVHHIRPRSEGGSNAAANLVGLCCAHHRAAHRGDLSIERTASGLRVRHADGRPYGDVQAPTSLDMRAKVYSALRNLGFREADVRAVLAELHEGAIGDDPSSVTTVEQLLREALVRLGPGRPGRSAGP